MSSDRFDDNQKLPPWLRDVPLPPRPRANETAPQSAAPVPEAASAPTSPASDLPDWLRDVSAEPAGTPSSAASTPAASANDLPDWLRDFSNTPTGAGTQAPSSAGDQNQPGRPASAANNALPDWLQDLGGNGAPAAPAQANDIPERADLPDWLREVQDATPPVTPPASAAPEAPAPSGEAMPSWLAGLADSQTSAPNAWAPSPEPAAQRAPDDEQGMPNWLRPDAPASIGPAAAAQPSWLQPDDLPAQPQGPAPSASEDEDTLPSWLRSTPEDQSSSDNLAPFTLDDPGDTGGRAAPPRSSWLSNELEDDAGMPSWLQPGDASAGHTFRNEPSQQNDQASTSEAPSSGDVPSWLADTTSSAPEAPSSGDVPSWLADTTSSAPEAPSSGDVPSWLADTTSSAPEAPGGDDVPSWLADTATSAPEAPGGDDVPSWLADTATSAPEAPSGDDVPSWLAGASANAPEAPGGDVPDWLKASAPAEPAPGQPSADNLPAWLRDTAASAPSQADETPAWLSNQADEPLAPPSEAAPPAWLASDIAAPATQPAAPAENSDSLPGWLTDTAPSGSPAAPPAADDLPAWLRPSAAPASAPPTPPAADELPPWLRDDAGQPLPVAGTSGDSKLPTWLQGASADLAPAAPAEEAVPASSWLNEAPEAPAAPADSLVGGVELPPWLRPPEAEPAKEEINPTDARSLDWLTRLGAQEEEEAEAAPQANRLRPRALPQRSASQIEAIALLEQLAAEPFPAPLANEPSETPAMWQRVGVERLLYAVLALAVVLALLTPAPNFLGINDPPSAPGAAALFTQIDALGENDIVLVGYEWDARRSGELRPLEQAVFDHLIARHVKLVLISTDPQGSLLLYDLRERLGSAGYKPSGEDYILLGYKPGAELALRAMAQNFPATLTSDFQGNDASTSLLATTPDHQQRLKTLSDFSMVLVLSDEASDVQGWMEQVRPSAQRADGSSVPFAFVLPAETAPIVQPYLGQPNVFHLAGKQGALAYQQQRGNADARIVAEAGQQRFSLLLYLILLVVGALVVGIYSAATRGRNRK